MEGRILLVDDEENVLQAYVRVLRRRFRLETALGGGDALQILQEQGPFAVVVSDMRMPGMDGVELLSRVREQYPDCIRLMLTGNADQSTATEAVNRGAIFRFLTKPCDPETLAANLQEALIQHRLVASERELLEKTLKGAIAMVGDLLSLLDPASFGRAQAMAKLAEQVAREMGMPDAWSMGVAATLSQIGMLTLPGSVVTKLRTGSFLSAAEREIAHSVPDIGSNLVCHIPRMEGVAASIRYMTKNFNGTGFPHDEVRGGEIPLGGRILRVLNDFVRASDAGDSPERILADMEIRKVWYDIAVLQALRAVLEDQPPVVLDPPLLKSSIDNLQEGQVLAADVITRENLLILPKGTYLGKSHLERIRNFYRIGEIGEVLLIFGS